jgi:chromosome segregation protein
MLTSLELFGFKSFADRTLFEFSPGITCVVGPNGSGKSNVVDAIKWILGDQSAKSLRGKEMSDVIFNGSSGRKPSGFAEATLAFDNRARYLSLDAAEVRVGRRLYRSGDSEYLLNGNIVRLKDVRDVFMGSGAGTAAYSIIEQGRVDQILQANPTTRRVVFEEAAGISRYKNRKIDAERKLEKVAQNLLRLTDIVDEVEAQLTATRSQASKAARFRELARELQTAWTGLAADDDRVQRRELARVDAEATVLQQELAGLLAQATALDAGKSQVNAELTQLEDSLRGEERRLALLREQIAAQESTIRHQSTREIELQDSLDRLREDRLSLTLQAAAVARELQQTTLQLELFESRVVEQRAELEERETGSRELTQEVEQLRLDIRRARTERDVHRDQIGEHERQASRLQSQLETVESALRQGEEQLRVLRLAERDSLSERDRLGLARDELESQQAEHLAALEAQRLVYKQLLAQQAELEQGAAKLRERRSAAVARIHVLEDLERRQEGVSIGVREILRRAHDSPHPPWNQILGSVSDLLQVALEHAPLLEVALGTRSQLVVVKRLAPVLDYLNRQATPIAGRVGFLELRDAATPESPLVSGLARQLLGLPGVVDRADRLAEAIPETAALPAQLLSDTWIVENLDAAARLALAHAGQRWVTLQGELIERDGAIFAGTIPNTTALVSRRSELRDLKHEVIRIDRNVERGTQQAELCAAEIAEAVRRVTELDDAANRQRQRIMDARSACDSQQRECDRISRQKQQLQQEHDGRLSTREGLVRDRETGTAEMQRLRQTILDAEERIQNLDQRTTEAAEELNVVREELKRQQLALAQHEERLAGLRDTHRRLVADQQQRESRRDAAVARVNEATESLRQTRLTILRTRAVLDSAFLSVEQQSAALRDRIQSRLQLREKWSVLAAEEESLHRRRRTLEDQRHQLEIQLRDLRQNLAQLDERIREEYQQPLAEFVAAGCSAYRDWMRGRGDADQKDSHSLDTASKAANTPDSELDLLYELGTPTFAEVRPELDEQVQRVRRKLKLLGSVNTDALAELDELESRFAQLSAQLQDLQEAKATLEEIIRRINKESCRIFLETFESIRTNFRELFRKVFGGGEGDIILEDAENVLDCGIDIVARPPGKELRSITLLSGGEKTMTAVALLFAMFKSKPSPYCILDEVDAALDEANVDRYVNVVREFAEQTQFIVITHRKRTMTAAAVLYGVTMEQAGVSKRMAVRFDDVSDDGNFKTRPQAA